MKKIWVLVFILSIASLEANDCIDKAFVSFQKKDYKAAIAKLKSCEEEILGGNSNKDIIKYYYGLGRSYLEMGVIDSAFKYQLISYNLKKSLNEETNLNLSLNDLGILYNKKGLPHKSLFFLNNAIKLNSEIGNKELLFNNYLNLGVTYDDLNFKDSTEKYYLLALELINEVDSEEKSNLYNNLGVLYKKYRDYDNSIIYLTKAIETYNQDELEHLKSLTNLELTYFYKNESTSTNSLIKYNELAQISNTQYFMADAYFKLSLFNIDNKELSMEYIKKSIRILNSIQNFNGSLYILREYKQLSDSKGIVNPELEAIENQLLVANVNRIAQEYGNEMKIIQESEVLINNLQKELYYTNIGYYGLLLIILAIISLVAISIYAIKKYKLVNKFIELIRNTNSHNIVGTNSAKSELGKLTYMLDQRLKYKGNEQVYSTLDNIINNVNNLDTIYISSSNKEAENQLLQHQRTSEKELI